MRGSDKNLFHRTTVLPKHPIDEIKDPSHQHIREDHQVYDSVVYSLGGTLVALAFKYGAAHRTLGLGSKGKRQQDQHQD